VSTDWIPIKNTTVFTGQNDGGKTSALDALTLLLDKKAEPDKNDYSIVQDGVLPVEKIIAEGVFVLNSEERQILGTSNGALHVRREFIPSKESKYVYKTKVHPDERFQRDLMEIPITELTALGDEFGVKLSNRRTKDVVVKEIRTWLTLQQLVEGWLELPRNLMEKMPQIKVFESAEALNPEHEINSTLKNSFSTRIRGEATLGS